MNARVFTLIVLIMLVAAGLAYAIRSSNLRQSMDRPRTAEGASTSTAPVEDCDKTVKVAFGNSKEDPDVLDCEKTYVVERTVCGDSLDEVGIAIHELLKGPTEEEKAAGFTTSLPENLPDPVIGIGPDGRLLIDFDPRLEEGVAGSCRVGAIRAQILDTVELNRVQPNDGVGISIRGRTEDILQP